MVDVLGMIAEPDEIAAPHQVHELEPRLMRHGDDQRLLGQLDQSPQHASGLVEMFHHLEGEGDVVSPAVEGGIEDVGAAEAELRPAGASGIERIGSQIDAFIIFDMDAEARKLVEREGLAASEVQNASRGERAELTCERGVEPAQAQAMQRVRIVVFRDMALCRVVPDRRGVHR